MLRHENNFMFRICLFLIYQLSRKRTSRGVPLFQKRVFLCFWFRKSHWWQKAKQNLRNCTKCFFLFWSRRKLWKRKVSFGYNIGARIQPNSSRQAQGTDTIYKIITVNIVIWWQSDLADKKHRFYISHNKTTLISVN